MGGKEIVVLVRPDSVSWEEISMVLKRSHAENVRKGIILPYPQLPPEELYAKTEGRGGKMFVAMCEEKIVGTGAITIIEKNIWCGNGKYAYCFLDAVLPEYAGKGAYSRIEKAQEEYARNNGTTRLLLDTDERNERMIDISMRNGFKKVEYRIREGRKSVVLVKWLDGCPYSSLRCGWTFLLKKMKKRRSALLHK